jgi:glutamate-1-semialdehyde 2,1-aminomutase
MNRKTSKSGSAYNKAVKFLQGGVNSPVRAFGAVGGNPLFIDSSSGCRIRDIDGNEYIDYVYSWGPLIAGHAHPAVVEAVISAARKGITFGAPTLMETELAERICRKFPSIERVRLVNSGTEAVMSAIRLARAVTGKELIVKCAGGYHGHVDCLLVSAGSGATTFGSPSSPGVLSTVTENTRVVPFNSLDSISAVFEEEAAGQMAAVIVEPVAGNMGVIPPQQGYLEGVRDLTKRNGALLIFDEVITGFRLTGGGAQQLYGVSPDITCLGKIIGGGLPVGAYGGSKDIMKMLSPTGPVYQAGTLSGNPIAMSAGIATLDLLDEEAYEKLDELGSMLEGGLASAANRANVPVTVNRAGSMLCPFFTTRGVRNYEDALTADKQMYAKFFHGMLEKGVYPPPSQFESWFLSLAHTQDDIERTLESAGEVLKDIATE